MRIYQLHDQICALLRRESLFQDRDYLCVNKQGEKMGALCGRGGMRHAWGFRWEGGDLRMGMICKASTASVLILSAFVSRRATVRRVTPSILATSACVPRSRRAALYSSAVIENCGSICVASYNAERLPSRAREHSSILEICAAELRARNAVIYNERGGSFAWSNVYQYDTQ